MVGRALNLATVTLLLCWGMAGSASAQENLDAGKNPSQLFAGNCSACHKSPRGLLKTVAPGSLPGFLRQHYTTGPEMAGALSAYVLSNGAADGHAAGEPARGARGGRNAKPTEAEPPPPPPAPSSGGPFSGLGRLFHPSSPAPDQAAPPPENQPAAHAKRRAKHHPKPAANESAKPAAEDKPAADAPATH